MKETLTIRESVARCQAEGLAVSEYALRLWVKQGLVPHVVAGHSKVLIFFPNLRKFLTGADSPGGEA